MCMKFYLLVPVFGMFSTFAICQMNAQDSLINSEAHWLDYDCYEFKNSYKVFPSYSNGQESCVIYNLDLKDSIVKYYYSSCVASIGIYYGCIGDTIWSTNYTEIKPGINIPSRQIEVEETPNREDYFVTIDSAKYVFYTGYQVIYFPIYEMTLFNEDGKIIERKWNGNTLRIDFSTIERNIYRKPE